MKQTMLMVACFLASSALAQESPNKSTDQQRLADRVYEWISDLTVDRDQLIEKRYAVLMDGLLILPSTSLAQIRDGQIEFTAVDIPSENPFQRIYVRHGMSFDYRAVNQIAARSNWSGGPEPQQHHWLEFLRAGETTRGRSLLANESDRKAADYIDRPDDIPVGKWYEQEFGSTKGFTPHDSFVIPYAFGLARGFQPESVERTLLSDYELQGVEPQVGGMMISNWVRTIKYGDLLLSITHDPSKKWMPSNVSLTSGKGWPKDVKVDQHMRLLHWRQVDGFWLPHMIDHSMDLGGTARHVRQVLKLQWTVGSKAPDAAFDPTTADLRQPIMDHFGAEFMRIVNGQLMPAPDYQTPTDLLEEFQAKRSKESDQQP